jgi:exosortase
LTLIAQPSIGAPPCAGGKGGAQGESSRSAFRIPSSIFYLLPLAWLWFRLIDHLRIEWAVNPQYGYGWAVPFLCVYLLWRNAESTGGKAEILKSETLKSAGQEGEVQSLKSKVQSRETEVTGQRAEVTGGKAEMLKGGNAGIPASFSVSAFQRFSFFLLCLLYLPTRLIQEANPEWRLVSWSLAIEVIGLTLLCLRIIDHVSRFTVHASRFTFPICFFFVAVPWPTVVEGPVIQGLMRANIGATIELLGIMGVPAVQHGSIIEIASGMVGIDDACSGIRSFQATLMISLFLGEVYALSARRRALCVLAGFALAFIFNVGRTLLLTRVAAAKGVGAVAAWHDPAGVTILVGCFLCLWLIARALQRAPDGEKSKVQSLKSKVETAGVRAPPPSDLRPLNSDLSSVRSPVVPRSVVSSPGPSSISAFQYFSIFLTVWLVLVEVGTELWYRSHEWRVPKAATWRVEFPRENATFRELPFSDKTKQFLRYDEGFNGVWQQGRDEKWQAIFLRWNPGRIAVHLAKSHTPEVCLTAAGRELVAQSSFRAVPVHGLQLPFRSYVVKDENGPLHVFYCLWEDRADAQSFRTTRMSYANRLAPVLAGRRNSGQRSLEVAISGFADQQEAELALASELQKLIKLDK